MKKGIIAIIVSLMLFACGETHKATHEISFYLSSDSENQTFMAIATYTYNEDEIISGKIEIDYQSIEENPTNNVMFDNYRILENALSDVEGVSAMIETTEKGYKYIEDWDFTKVDVNQAIIVDERQEGFVKDGFYDLDMIKEYYHIRGYSESIKELSDD